MAKKGKVGKHKKNITHIAGQFDLDATINQKREQKQLKIFLSFETILIPFQLRKYELVVLYSTFHIYIK